MRKIFRMTPRTAERAPEKARGVSFAALKHAPLHARRAGVRPRHAERRAREACARRARVAQRRASPLSKRPPPPPTVAPTRQPTVPTHPVLFVQCAPRSQLVKLKCARARRARRAGGAWGARGAGRRTTQAADGAAGDGHVSPPVHQHRRAARGAQPARRELPRPAPRPPLRIGTPKAASPAAPRGPAATELRTKAIARPCPRRARGGSAGARGARAPAEDVNCRLVRGGRLPRERHPLRRDS
jgi:hypothetical protein